MMMKRNSHTNNERNAEDLEELSNHEIAARLKSLGQMIGPVGPTTRKVYIKKLAKLLEQGDSVMQPKKQYEDEEENIPAVQTRSGRRVMFNEEQPVVPSHKSMSAPHVARLGTIDSNVELPATQPMQASVTKRRPLRSSDASVNSYTEDNSTTTIQGPTNTTKGQQGKSRSTQPQRSWFPIYVQVILTLLIVLLFYLVLQAMESDPEKLRLPSD